VVPHAVAPETLLAQSASKLQMVVSLISGRAAAALAAFLSLPLPESDPDPDEDSQHEHYDE